MIELFRTKSAIKYFHHSAQVNYVLTDLHGNCIYINPLFLRRNNFVGVDAAGTPFSAFIQQGEHNRYKAVTKQCLDNPSLPVVVDLHHSLGDDAFMLIRWEFQVLLNETQETKAIQGIGIEIKETKTPSKLSEIDTISEHERFRAYELSAEGLWRLDLEIPVSTDLPPARVIEHCRRYGFIAECNDNMARMYGLGKGEEMIGMKMDSLMNLDEPKQIEYLEQFIRNGYSISGVETQEHDINRKRLFSLINMMGIIENGMLKRIWGTRQDITAKKAAEEQLQRSELFYRNLIADSLDGVLLTDTNGTITFASPSVEKILGYTSDHIIRTNTFDYVHPDDRDTAIAAFQDEINMDPQVKFIEIRLKNKYGQWVWCNVRGHNMLYNPYIGRIAIYFHDDTLRKKTECALRESEKRFRQLIDNLKTGILLQDTNAKIVIANQAAFHLLGVTEDQLMGKTSFDPSWNVIHEDGSNFPSHDHPVPVAIQTRSIVSDVIMGVYRPLQNDRVWLLVNAEPVFSEKDELLHIICSFTDITEQKRLSQELINQEVQKQKQLTQATIDAQEKERLEIGKELHDNINQHLTTTRLYLEVAHERATGKDVKEMISDAKKGLGDIINEIRKLSQSLVPHTLGDVGLVESIKDICGSLRRTYAFTINFDHSNFEEHKLSDNIKLMIFRIIQEQVNNIVKHAAANLVTIRIETVQDILRSQIEDNGKGFDPAKVKKGLGLTNIMSRADLLKGQVQIVTAPGQGCILKVELPLK